MASAAIRQDADRQVAADGGAGELDAAACSSSRPSQSAFMSCVVQNRGQGPDQFVSYAQVNSMDTRMLTSAAPAGLLTAP